MNIGVDFDDVLLDFNTHFIAYFNKMKGTSLKRDDLTSFYLETIVGGTHQEMVDLITDFYDTTEHAGGMPMEGAREAIKALHEKGNKLFIVTSKPEYLREITDKWLALHFPGMFESVHFTNHFHPGEGVKRVSKAEICDELGIKIFIDDHIENAKNVAKEGREVLLLDSPWNKNEIIPPYVRRVYSWQEIVEILS